MTSASTWLKKSSGKQSNCSSFVVAVGIQGHITVIFDFWKVATKPMSYHRGPFPSQLREGEQDFNFCASKIQYFNVKQSKPESVLNESIFLL